MYVNRKQLINWENYRYFGHIGKIDDTYIVKKDI